VSGPNLGRVTKHTQFLFVYFVVIAVPVAIVIVITIGMTFHHCVVVILLVEAATIWALVKTNSNPLLADVATKRSYNAIVHFKVS
jgi:hypothetical protein